MNTDFAATFWLRAFAATILLVAVLCPNSAAQIQELKKPDWSVSLELQGFRRTSGNSETQTVVNDAASGRNSIAILPCTRNQNPGKVRRSRTWNCHLLFYDSGTGRFLSRKGPWQSTETPRLLAVPGDQWLLILGQAARVENGPSELHLLLMSFAGEETKRLELAAPPDKALRRSTFALVSPSGQTILTVDKWPSETRYRLIDTESLCIKRDWTEFHEPGDFEAKSISDNRILGTAVKDSHSLTGIRKFDGAWQELPELVRNNTWWTFKASDFLDEEDIAGRVVEEKNELIFRVYGTNGRISKEYAAPKPAFHSFASPINPLASQDGTYFGLRVIGENALSYWWGTQMDMWQIGTTYYLYLWRKDSEAAIGRIKVGPNGTKAAFFLYNEPKIVVVDDLELKVFSMSANTPGE